MTEGRGCEHCAYKLIMVDENLKPNGIIHCFANGLSFQKGAIVDCDNWKTDDIPTQFEQHFGFSLPKKLVDVFRKKFKED